MINNLFKKTAAILSIITISLLAQVVNAKSEPPKSSPPGVTSESTEEDSSVKKPAKMLSTMKKPGDAMKTNSRG